MLTIRLSRTGRKGLAMYRVIAQEHIYSPSSGKVAAYLGHYDPHSKEFAVDKEKVEYYLSNGAQPSNTVAKLLKKEGVKLPKWVKIHKYPERPSKNASEEDQAAPAGSAQAPANDGKEEPQKEDKAEDSEEDKAPADSDRKDEKDEKEPSDEKSEDKQESAAEKPADK